MGKSKRSEPEPRRVVRAGTKDGLQKAYFDLGITHEVDPVAIGKNCIGKGKVFSTVTRDENIDEVVASNRENIARIRKSVGRDGLPLSKKTPDFLLPSDIIAIKKKFGGFADLGKGWAKSKEKITKTENQRLYEECFGEKS